MILIFSENANASPQINREVERGVNRGVYIIPFRVDDIQPTRSLEYFISTAQWMDAFSPPLEKHLDNLAKTVVAVLANPSLGETVSTETVKPDARTPVRREPEVSQEDTTVRDFSANLREPAAERSKGQTSGSPRRPWIPIAGAAVGLLIICAAGYHFGLFDFKPAPVVTPKQGEDQKQETPVVKLGRATFITDQLDLFQELSSYLQQKGVQVAVLDTGHFGDLSTTWPDVIIVGPDTGKVWYNTSKTILGKLFENYKVIGFGEGGAALFAQLGLEIADGHGMHGNLARVAVEIPELLQSPLSVAAQDKIVEIYPASNADVVGIYDEGSPVIAGFEGIARWTDDKNHWPFCRQGNYLLWGFNAPAGEMTDAGRQLFVNLLLNHKERPSVPLSQTHVKVSYVKPGLISERLTKQFTKQAWPFQISQPGPISVQLSWSPPELPLALILNGPGQVGYFARQDGRSPQKLVYGVTDKDVAKGTDWRISVTCFGDLDSTAIDYKLDLSFPDGSTPSAKREQ
jgi:hypothetical protein